MLYQFLFVLYFSLNIKFVLNIRKVINVHKFEWETFNTQKIMIYFFSHTLPFFGGLFTDNYGSKIRIKCHQPISRRSQTLNGENCSNWRIIDSLEVKASLNESFYRPLEVLSGLMEEG